jgi:16S rRNA (uracil1498-N3)-methyltransferase
VKARFYAPDAHAPGDLVVLPADEAAHLSRVLRLVPGDPVRVFNGRGQEFDARVAQVGRRDVQIAVGRAAPAAAEPRVAVTLALAVLKADGTDAAVRDAVMLGVAAIQPVVSHRSEVGLATLERGRRRVRWERIAIASAKQCGRATMPDVRAPRRFEALLEDLAEARLPRPAVMFVEPGAAAHAVSLAGLDVPRPAAATVLVGPEGGWAPGEIARAEAAACRLVTLRLPTIRAAAMPAVVLAAVLAAWGEL